MDTSTLLPPPLHHIPLHHTPVHPPPMTPLGTRMESLLYVINEQRNTATSPSPVPPISLSKTTCSPPSMSIANLVHKPSIEEENRTTVTETNTQLPHTTADSRLKRKVSEDLVPRPSLLQERIRCMLRAGTLSPAQKRQKKSAKCFLRDFNAEEAKTTVRCYHASIAQKSYGSEKRFLCPPPLVTVIGPGIGQRNNPVLSANLELSMSIAFETGDFSLGQKSPVDPTGQASFKYLYVGGTAKTKTFNLKLEMSRRRPPGSETLVAAFESPPIGIISKPSKKTAKSRNVTSRILSGTTVSLFNRINSQTVRTKYMDVDGGVLCAKNSSWSPFTITVTSRSPSPLVSTTSTNKRVVRASSETKSASPSSAVMYGSEIMLVDTANGLSSGPFVIRKVDKNHIARDATGPVIQMQKIALERVTDSNEDDNAKEYLSASGASGPTSTSRSPSPVSEDGQTNGTRPLPSRLIYGSSRSTVADEREVDDHLCWTIVGISKFEHSYIEALGPASAPVTPFPTLTSPVTIRSCICTGRGGRKVISATLYFCILDFFPPPTDPTDEERTQHLDIWLGDSGPIEAYFHLTEDRSRVDGDIVYPRTGEYFVSVQLPSLSAEDIQQMSSPPIPSSAETDAELTSSENSPTSSLSSITRQPLLLVRKDGVAYHTSTVLVYELDSDGKMDVRVEEAE